jgi:hypothetical protein
MLRLTLDATLEPPSTARRGLIAMILHHEKISTTQGVVTLILMRLYKFYDYTSSVPTLS